MKVLHYTLVAVIATAALVSAQKKTWTLPHLPDGQPDFTGYWTNSTYTPLERDREFGTKEFFTPEEAVAYAKKREQIENSQSKDDIHYDNVIWQGEKYAKVVTRSRTSIIYDPPDGRIPDLTPAAKALVDCARRRSAPARAVGCGQLAQPGRALHLVGQRGAADGRFDVSGEPADRPDEERVRHPPRDHARGPDHPRRWHAARREERPHALRRLARPMGRRHARRRHHQLHRSHAVPRSAGHHAAGHLHRPRTPRHRAVHAAWTPTRSSIASRSTIPATFVRPWSGEMVIRKMEGPLFEYACHEGNYGLANILSAARVEERSAGGQTAP